MVSLAQVPGGLQHGDRFHRLIVQQVDSGEFGVGLHERGGIRAKFHCDLVDSFEVAVLGVFQLGALQLLPAAIDGRGGVIGRECRAHGDGRKGGEPKGSGSKGDRPKDGGPRCEGPVSHAVAPARH